MKIGVTCYPTVGGSGILATRLGLELADRGHEVHFITYERPSAIQGVDHRNVRVHLVNVVDYPLFKYPPYTVALGSAMVKYSREHALDVLHVHYSLPHATAALLASEITGIPYVVTLHGSDVTILGSDPSYLPVNSYAVQRADAVTAVSDFIRREAYARLCITRDVRVIPNFVDPEVYSPAQCNMMERNGDRDVVIIHISNFRPVKRIQDLVYAMTMVVKRAQNARLVLVGDGPERYDVERLIDHLGLSRNVLVTGFRSDVADLLRCSDIFVLCSQSESAPLALLEGMSSGLPVVATSVGGIPEIVRDGFNGFLVPPKHPEALAAKIIELNEDKQLRRRLGEAARSTILERYTAENVVQRYEEVLERVIKN